MAGVRIPNAAYVQGRNIGDTADIPLVRANASDEAEVGVAGTVTRLLGSSVALGAAPLRLDNAQAVEWRNNANTAWLSALFVNASDQIIAGNTGTGDILLRHGVTTKLRIESTQIQLKNSTRLDNNLTLRSRNGANTADIDIVRVDASDIINIGAAANTALILGPLDCNAAFRPARGTAFPSGPVEGEFFFRTDLDEMFFFDGSRSKWLGIALQSRVATRNAAGVAAEYLWIHNITMNAQRGFQIPNDITVVGLAWNGGGTWTAGNFEVQRDSTLVVEVAHGTNIEGSDMTLNADFAGAAAMQVFHDGGSADQPSVTVFFRRHAT